MNNLVQQIPDLTHLVLQHVEFVGNLGNRISFQRNLIDYSTQSVRTPRAKVNDSSPTATQGKGLADVRLLETDIR